LIRRPYNGPMTRTDFERDTRYCSRCRVYVRYLLSTSKAYCVECGESVRLFSQPDRDLFNRELKTWTARFHDVVEQESDRSA